MLKKVGPLSAIIALRFLGLFIVLPVLSVYALELPYATKTLVGITIGGYALTQMLFQVPFGALSDRIGRKKTIAFGLMILFLGSIIAALANDIYTLMAGRFLQGAGAIGAVASALLSDLVSEEKRTSAMALMGGSIALSFAISMGLGPVLGGLYGIGVLFWITAVCSIFALIVLFTKVPNPPKIKYDYENRGFNLKTIFKNDQLFLMNITNFLQKGMMTLAFLIIPIVMISEFGFEKSQLWKVYFPALVLGIFAMGLSAVFGEKYKKSKLMLMLGVVLFGVSYSVMGFTNSYMFFIFGVALFFIGFNIHEPLMQSLASRYAKVNERGVALGVFNSFGHLGTFLGGALGGLFYENFGLGKISLGVLIVVLLWIFLLLKLKNPHLTKNLYLKFSEIDLSKIGLLSSQNGVIEYYQNESEELLVIKYNSIKTDELKLKQLFEI
ncbi:MAG: MFS transporter [Sulfurospirillaceae bacterium]|nr:MFS transporter [Sulfurospirillaceae bacterium]